MKYEYKCEDCDAIIMHEASMGSTLPKVKVCPKCKKNSCVYDFRQVLNSTINIPDHMKAGKDRPSYTKMPTEFKKYH